MYVFPSNSVKSWCRSIQVSQVPFLTSMYVFYMLGIIIIFKSVYSLVPCSVRKSIALLSSKNREREGYPLSSTVDVDDMIILLVMCTGFLCFAFDIWGTEWEIDCFNWTAGISLLALDALHIGTVCAHVMKPFGKHNTPSHSGKAKACNSYSFRLPCRGFPQDESVHGWSLTPVWGHRSAAPRRAQSVITTTSTSSSWAPGHGKRPTTTPCSSQPLVVTVSSGSLLLGLTFELAHRPRPQPQADQELKR